ncbi:DUF1684 domain-containing protein [Promicromonospora sp. NPDC057138]|uniref:DUF1684 domain-containing protein n=1 Tax=Promicromonospora sp. NPDC057138 TaxID=3346031 RepID=UPI0036396573
MSAPVDLRVTIAGTEYLLTVLEDIPGQRLVVFTDETNGTKTPEIGRWLVLPLLDPGSTLTVDLNRASESTIDENVAGMASQIGAIESMRYEIVRQLSRPGDVLQQHVVHVTMQDGARFQVHAAVYFGFAGGLITRIEEYAGTPSGDEG